MKRKCSGECGGSWRNSVYKIKSSVRRTLSDAESSNSRHNRLLTDVPSIKIFQKRLISSSVSIDGDGRVEESQLKGLEDRLATQLEDRLATQQEGLVERLAARQEEDMATLESKYDKLFMVMLMMNAFVFLVLLAALIVYCYKSLYSTATSLSLLLS